MILESLQFKTTWQPLAPRTADSPSSFISMSIHSLSCANLVSYLAMTLDPTLNLLQGVEFSVKDLGVKPSSGEQIMFFCGVEIPSRDDHYATDVAL